MNTPILFELAKLLKEKGFDGQCLNFYTKPNSKMFGIDEHYRNYPIKNTPKKLYTVGEHAVLNIENVYFAPTIAEIVMWCFNKYKYSIEYSMNIPESGEYDGCYVFNGLIKGSEDYKLKIFYTSKDYPTAEKALEDTINHFLINFC